MSNVQQLLASIAVQIALVGFLFTVLRIQLKLTTEVLRAEMQALRAEMQAQTAELKKFMTQLMLEHMRSEHGRTEPDKVSQP